MIPLRTLIATIKKRAKERTNVPIVTIAVSRFLMNIMSLTAESFVPSALEATERKCGYDGERELYPFILSGGG